MRTIIRRFGNKSKYLKQIKKYLPENYNTYFEPFVGSGVLFLSFKPSRWILNDLNSDMIGIWNEIKYNPDKIKSYFIEFGDKFKVMQRQEQIQLCKNITKSLENSNVSDRYIKYLLMLLCSYTPQFSSYINFNSFLFPVLKVKDHWHFL